ncbi:MAG TPA: ATP-binding protein [Bryobacteraceae bacterium]|nr:ATP-binding protein [Bryobacteraceae bacterium]
MPKPIPTAVVTVIVRDEADVVSARQRARQVAALAGFSNQDQVRIATAVSEIARNAIQYGGGGRVEFGLALQMRPQALWITVADQGRGIENLDSVLAGRRQFTGVGGIGLVGSRRLMDTFGIESSSQGGTIVRLSKNLPLDARIIRHSEIAAMAAQLARERPSPNQEGRIQKRDLLETLEVLRLREVELEERQIELRRMSSELDETNRGVVALYAELDEKAAALRSADELKGRFLRHVSHEFRTPLNSIRALSQLLLRHTDGPLTAEQALQVGYIRQAAQDLTELVNDLLDLAKVEAGKTEIHLSRIQLGQLFGTLRGVLRPLVTGESVALVFGEPPEDLWFESDESKVAQILRNLISNALKFTEHGEVRVSYRVTGTCLILSVADTGIGIARQDQERIFQEFTQINSEIQGRVKGTGLGLPLARKLAGLLGGELTLASSPGLGSTFSLRLPLGSAAAVEHAATHVSDGDSVLIIDDDEAARYVVRHRFRGTSHRLLEAGGGIEGAERARFERPALILLDLVMPDRSGFEVLDDLKNDPATRDIPVIIHTSRRLTESDFERLGKHHAGILPKGDFWPPEMLEYMKKTLGEPGLFTDETEGLSMS